MDNLQTLSGAAIAFSEFRAESDELDGRIADLDGGTLRAVGRRTIKLPKNQSHLGYVASCGVTIAVDTDIVRIPEGFYFSVFGDALIEPRSPSLTKGFIVSRGGYECYLMAGKLEHDGRLRYIDGCTDSLLIPPIKLGDPCLNLLYFPPDTDQTMHTHPSDRIGMILSGQGECVTIDDRGAAATPLIPGMLFCIHTGGRHKFRTMGEEMRVLAFHPDSDFGPTDQDHPMINRTMVNGVSASQLTAIHT